jgi:putative ABC transport system permease protein
MSPSRLLLAIRYRLRAVARQSAVDAELDRELAFHVDQLTSEYEAEGLPPAEARQAARRTLGNLPLLADECRDQRGLSWLADLRQDLVVALRTLARTPRVTSVMLASLALGIGANAAVLGVLDAVLREPLPIADANRVVVVRTVHRDPNERRTSAMVADYVAWRERNQSFERIGIGFGNQADFAADDRGAPAERVQGQAVNGELFEVLRVQPVLGRVFTESEVREPIRPLVISHRLWQRRFGGAPEVLGMRVRMNQTHARVVGVMPEGFHYPAALVDFWVPLAIDRGDATSQRLFAVTGRLREGITAEQAEADLNRIAAQLELQAPAQHAGWGVRILPVRRAMFGWTYGPLTTLATAVALVLLVACTNVAGLLLARTIARRPEVMVRTALGAGRWRLVRQLLMEGALIAAGGAVLAVAVAWMGAHLLLSTAPPPVGAVALGQPDMMWRIVALTAALAPIAGLLAAVVPALVGSRVDLSRPQHAAAGAVGDGSSPRLREGFVAAQVCITFVLLIAAALQAQSFVSMVRRELHYDPHRVLAFDVHLPPGEFMRRSGSAHGMPLVDIAPVAAETLKRIHEGLLQVPGAMTVAGISTPLLNALILPTASVAPADGPAAVHAVAGVAERRLDVPYFVVTPGFFTAMRASLVRGRDFTADDVVGAPWVAIVNEQTARELWPGRDPIGRLLHLPLVPDERPREVIGVVRDIPLRLRQVGTLPTVFTPYLQQPLRVPQAAANMFGRMTFMMRSSGDPRALLPAARQVVAVVDPERPLSGITSMDGWRRLWNPSAGGVAFVLSVFALTATLLAAIGIYGVVSYSAERRTREIGIRMALGAGVRDITTLVSGRALAFVSAGLMAGLLVAIPLTSLLYSQLWGITPTDPLTFAGALIGLLSVAAVASLLPTRRAMALNPTAALRE